MTSHLPRIACALIAAAALPAAAAGGAVQVAFDKGGEQFRDFGRTTVERENHSQQLSAHFAAGAARHLAAGQVLEVRMLDVDLAGDVRPVGRGGQDVRVLRGTADWPTLEFTWTLRNGERTLATGRERLSDMGYMQHPQAASTEALAHEGRVVSRWFRQQFGPQAD